MEILGDKNAKDLIASLTNVTIDGTKKVVRQNCINIVGNNKHDIDVEKTGGRSPELIIETPNSPRPPDDQVPHYVDHQIHMKNVEDKQHNSETSHETLEESKSLEDANMDIVE